MLEFKTETHMNSHQKKHEEKNIISPVPKPKFFASAPVNTWWNQPTNHPVVIGEQNPAGWNPPTNRQSWVPCIIKAGGGGFLGNFAKASSFNFCTYAWWLKFALDGFAEKKSRKKKMEQKQDVYYIWLQRWVLPLKSLVTFCLVPIENWHRLMASHRVINIKPDFSSFSAVENVHSKSAATPMGTGWEITGKVRCCETQLHCTLWLSPILSA